MPGTAGLAISCDLKLMSNAFFKKVLKLDAGPGFAASAAIFDAFKSLANALVTLNGFLCPALSAVAVATEGLSAPPKFLSIVTTCLSNLFLVEPETFHPVFWAANT